jgi:hypothetical protein
VERHDESKVNVPRVPGSLCHCAWICKVVLKYVCTGCMLNLLCSVVWDTEVW